LKKDEQVSRRNENRPGYKHTQIGWIPTAWQSLNLKNLCHEKAGIKTGPFGSQLHASDYVEVGVPVVMPRDMDNGRIKVEQIAKISEKKAAQLRSQKCEAGDILFARRGEIGRCTLITEKEKGYINGTGCLRVRLQDGIADPAFFTRYFTTRAVKIWLERNAVGQTMPNLSAEILSALPVIYPPYSEQKKIAEILSTWDNAIEQTRKLIEAKKRRKKALMQQLFSEKKRSTVGKGAWKKYRLKDLLQEVSRPIDFHDEDFYDLISVRRRSEGIFRRGRVAGKEILTKQLYRTHSGDFLISKMQVVHGASALVTAQFDGLNISGSYIALRCNDLKKLNMNFFNWLSRTPRFYHLTYLSSYGVHIEKMTFNLKLFLKSEISIPEKVEEQERIADFFEVVGKEIGTLENQLAALEKQKRGLMQKLLTGEVRVKT
jgi:type I restriction enzyme S subunit